MNKYKEKSDEEKSQHDDGSHTNDNPEMLNSLTTLPGFQKDIANLSQVFQQLFGTENLGNYCCYTDGDKECSDGSDLYTIIKYQGRDLLVKVGCGEFNTKVFTTRGVKELKGFTNSPVSLFVVNQGHSYLGSDDDKRLRDKTPKAYLHKYAVIVSPKGGEAYYRHVIRDGEMIDFNDIHIRHYADALALGRLAVLRKTFSEPMEFSKAMNTIQQLQHLDFEEFYTRTAKGEKFSSDEEKKVLGCFRHMAIHPAGSGVGDREAYQSLYDLIQTFDIHQRIFRP